MKQSLPRELEKHLKKKCLSLLSYYQPEWGTLAKHSFIYVVKILVLIASLFCNEMMSNMFVL